MPVIPDDPGQGDDRFAWHREIIAAAHAAGYKNASLDAPDSVLLAEARHLLAGHPALDSLAGALAADLAKHHDGPVQLTDCAMLARAAANLRGLLILGIDGGPMLGLLSAAASKLEMQAPADDAIWQTFAKRVAKLDPRNDIDADLTLRAVVEDARRLLGQEGGGDA